MDMLHSLGIALVMAFGALFSGIGMGCLVGFFVGTNTVRGRGRAILSGMLFGLFMLNAFIWLAYNGYRL